jgi:hypothetical protein
MDDALKTATDFALEWLNRFNPAEPLPNDYFTQVDVLYDDRILADEEEFELMLRLDSADDGGAARMWAQFVDGKIKWAAWYFDGTWGEMK